MNTAPDHIKFCVRCGAPLATRQVGDRPRRACTACDYVHFTDPKVGVGVFVLDEAGRVLLVRRVMNPERGKWSIPAGFLDQGGNPVETAVREAHEETGLDVVVDGLVDVYHNPPGEGGASIFILYRAHMVGGTLRAGDDADGVGFFARHQLPELAFTSTRESIKRLP